MGSDLPTDPAPRLEIEAPSGCAVFLLTEDVTKIGRADDNQVRVASGHVSKHHAEILRKGDEYLLRDIGSKAGVFCNDQVVSEHRLRDGDRITLGKSGATTLRFRTGERGASRTGESSLARAFSDTKLAAPSQSHDSLRQLARFLELSRTLSSQVTPREVVESVVDLAIEITQAERGFVVLVDDAGQLRLDVSRGRDADAEVGAPPAISETVVRQVLESKQPKVVSDIELDSGLAAAPSVMRLRLGSVAAIPLWRHMLPETQKKAEVTDAVFGVLCLDSTKNRETFAAADVGILQALARDASSAIENARLLRESVEKARLEQELARARQVQAALVPNDYWSTREFEVAGAYVPCLDLAGDYLGQFRRRDGEASFVVADVCGKGVQAALLAAALQGALLVEFASERSLGEVVEHANEVIARIAPVGKFISMVGCSLAPDGTLRYVNAGHCPLIVVRSGSLERLVTGGLALGLDPSERYEEHTLQLAPGDTFILYSDGVLEAMNSDRELFGHERLAETVTDAHGRPAEGTCAALLEALRAFSGDTPADDDTTLMVVTYRGESR